MRLGIFGGSFDPVHYGHLLLAEGCREQCPLDQVWFVPAAVSPHKTDARPAPAADRVAMLHLAIAGHEAFEIWTGEIDRGGVSYTVDTLRTIHQEDPSRELLLLLGADAVAELPTWREPEEICALAMPMVVRRTGAELPDLGVLAPLVTPERLAAIRQGQIDVVPLGTSSSELRRRAAAGRSLRYQTPRAVEKYIESHALYRDETATG